MNSKIYFLLLVILLVPLSTSAQEILYLVGIPGVDINADFGTYINTLYKLSIAIAALLAVIKIIIAGLKWMLTDLVTSKEDAKKDIQGAVLGLLIIIGAVVILETINTQLTETTVFVAPMESIDMSGVSDAKKAADCVAMTGDGYAWDEATGVCSGTKEAVDRDFGLTPKIIGCTAPGNCEAQKKECESKGGVASSSISIKTNQILNFQITCSSKASIESCVNDKGTWDYGIPECR